MTRRVLQRLAAALLGLGLAGPVSAMPNLFLIDSTHGVATEFYRVKPSNGQMRLMGSLSPALGEAAGLAAMSPEVFYVSTLLGNIVRIDLSPIFTVTPLGNVGGKLAMLEADGPDLLAVDEERDELVRITLDPLRKTVIGRIRVGSRFGVPVDIVGGDLARNSAGTWYLFSNWVNNANSGGTLYLLDPDDATVTILGPRSWGYGRITGLSFDPDDSGVLYASARDLDRLLIMSPMSGQVSWVTGLCRSCPTRYDISAGDLTVVRPPPRNTPTASRTPTATRTPSPRPPTRTATPTRRR
ncbi:MAG: hypothetical protein SF182_04470 [Deltaproteobacteria bacterium]|nr:hypothetical protein [Deltaproteobacteria bacterium]